MHDVVGIDRVGPGVAVPVGGRLMLHPLIAAAASGDLPAWAAAAPGRLRHMRRVAALLDTWSGALGLSEEERSRWRAAAYLHDALRDADPEPLREHVPPDLRGLPGSVLHGPAAAERLRVEGVLDGELLLAVAFHTVGEPRLGLLGRALYAADFLEPGRAFLPEWRAGLRERMPGELDDVVREVAGARISSLVDRRAALPEQTIRFWNALVSMPR